jgi:hypothetical protein
LSFWAKADANKNIAIEYFQGFGTGGSPSASVTGIGSQLISLTTTWQKKTVTVTLPSIVGKTLGTDGAQTTFTGIGFWFDAGSNWAFRSANLGQQSGTFDIAQIKIEDGSVATNGWHPYDGEFGSETQACARYYEKGNGSYYANSTNTWGIFDKFTTIKRVVPSITVSSGTTQNVFTDGFECFYNNLSSGTWYLHSWTASAEL